jgi:hypothetical protein
MTIPTITLKSAISGDFADGASRLIPVSGLIAGVGEAADGQGFTGVYSVAVQVGGVGQ